MANTLRFLASGDAETINTDYDEMKSVVTVIRGPLSPGTRVTLKFRRSADDQATYEIHNDVVPTTVNSPVIFINSYRINRRADVRIRAFIDGCMIAEKSFRARGPTDDSKPNWVMKEGDIRLTAKELREAIVGKRFLLDVGGTGFFRLTGVTREFVRNEQKLARMRCVTMDLPAPISRMTGNVATSSFVIEAATCI